MKKTYIHVKLQAPWNQGKASLELIEWNHTLKIGTLSSLKCLKNNITYTCDLKTVSSIFYRWEQKP
jgi:hypothetical protein